MTTQTLSPGDTGEIQLTEDPTRDLTRLRNAPPLSPLPRPELADTLVAPMPKRAGVFLPDLTHPDTMPVPPRPPTRSSKVLVPLEPREEPKRYVGKHRDPQGREGASGYVGRHVRPSLIGRVMGR